MAVLDWNFDPKLGALPWHGSTGQNAVVMFYNNLVADRQSQAATLSDGFGGEEGVE